MLSDEFWHWDFFFAAKIILAARKVCKFYIKATHRIIVTLVLILANPASFYEACCSLEISELFEKLECSGQKE
jgi:hypothetical protein